MAQAFFAAAGKTVQSLPHGSGAAGGCGKLINSAMTANMAEIQMPIQAAVRAALAAAHLEGGGGGDGKGRLDERHYHRLDKLPGTN